jgi:hypothetical protein
MASAPRRLSVKLIATCDPPDAICARLADSVCRVPIRDLVISGVCMGHAPCARRSLGIRLSIPG